MPLTIIALLAAVCWSPPPAPSSQIPPPVGVDSKGLELREARDAILARERSGLQGLTDRLRSKGKGAEADRLAPNPADLPAADGSSRFALLPEVVEPRPKGLPGGNAQPDAAEPIRSECVKGLFDLALRASKPPESYALVDECLRGVIARQSNHPEARRLLGFVPHQGGWATPFAARMLARGSNYDATYGWVPGDWLPRLKQGQLPAPGGGNRWLPADQADALRRDWARKWEISTEHFKVFTNVPLNQAIVFGRKLEDLHELFFALMADVIDPDRLPLARRLKGPTAREGTSKPPHVVYYFATRDEYARFLAPLQGEGAKVSLGTYVPRKESKAFGGVSYFFDDAGGQLDVTSTLYHEASHQLLFESAGPDDYARNSGQYWVFEGLGTYFETLQHEPDGSLRIGGLQGPRVEQARRRLIGGGEAIPIEQFVALNRPRFQGEQGGSDIYLNYAEAMALAVFLMQAEGGRHREGFLEYVRDVYKGRYRAGSGRSLDEELGMRYPELNRALLAYLAGKGG